MGYTDKEGDQEAVAGVQGVGEQGEDVSGQGAEKAEDKDGSGERYCYEVRQHAYEGDLVEGGCDYGRGRYLGGQGDGDQVRELARWFGEGP